MSWIDRFFGRVNLREGDRETILKLFGSFHANKIAANPANLITEGYEKNIDVYAVIKKIVDTSKAVPWIIEQKTREGWEVLEDTTLHDLMEKPNIGKGYTWDDVQEQIITYLLANGNSYMVGESGMIGNLIQEVDVLPSPQVTVKTTNDFFIPSPRYQFNLNAQTRFFEGDEVEHTMLFNPGYTTVQESFIGLSAIRVAAAAVQVGNDRWEADANLLQNRGAIGLITDKSNRPLTSEEGAQIQEAFDGSTTGPRNFGRIKVTNKDLSFVQMAMSSVDLQLIEKGVVNLRAICNVFGLDSSLFNDPANKTFNNRKEAEKSLYTNAVIPISEKIAAKHTSFLAANHFPGQTVRMRQDFSEVESLQADKKTEAEKDKIEMEGVNIILAMPISNEAKRDLLIEKYEFSDDLATIMTQDNAQG